MHMYVRVYVSPLHLIMQGFKLSRKSRDPAKEMAEWTKMKGLIGGPKGGLTAM